MSFSLEPRRHLDVEGTDNVRDIGGYPTSDGRSTRWKTVLRSDNVAGLSPGSQAALVEYGVRTVIDLRRDKQVRDTPNVFAASPHVRYFHHNFSGDLTTDELAASSDVARDWLERIKSLEMPAKKTAGYCMRLDIRGEAVRRTLSTLAAPGALPALYHCVAGKDRAGLVTALVLGIAGVPAETIAEDYTLSAYYRWRGSLKERGVEEPYEGAPPESFDAEEFRVRRENTPPEVMIGVLEYLDQRHGGVEGYALHIGVTPAELAALRRAIVQ